MKPFECKMEEEFKNNDLVILYISLFVSFKWCEIHQIKSLEMSRWRNDTLCNKDMAFYLKLWFF